MRERSGILAGCLHIYVLVAFAVAQPLFDLLSRNAEFFVARRSEPIDVLLLILILSGALPLLILILEAGAAPVNAKLRTTVRALAVMALVAAIALPALKRIPGAPDTALIGGAALLGAGAALAYARTRAFRLFLSVLSPAVVFFPALFLFSSSVAKVLGAWHSPPLPAPRVPAPAPVVLVVFDEFPTISLMDEGRGVDPIRYPNLARLAREATWFRAAVTVHGSTVKAVPAILSGTIPKSSQLPITADYPQNVFTVLGGAYTLNVFEPVTRLCPVDLCPAAAKRSTLAVRIRTLLEDVAVIYLHVVLPADLTNRLPPITQTWNYFVIRVDDPYRDRAGRFREFLAAISAEDQPALYFLHTFLPHVPWTYFPSGRQYVPGASVRGLNIRAEQWDDDDWAVTQAYQRHLLQVGFVDTLVGELITRLEDAGMYDSTLLVLTADHGAGFWPGESRRDARGPHGVDVLKAPLFIKAPHQRRGMVNDCPVRSVDILPTIAGVLGIELPYPVDGRSLVDHLDSPQQPIAASAKPCQVLKVSPAESASLRRKLALFGSGAKRDGLFRIGPYGQLVGRRTGEFPQVGTGRVTAHLSRAVSSALNLTAGSHSVPADITGVVSGADGPDTFDLAVAVNGVIQAVTRSFREGPNTVGFSAIVPESAFRLGRNDIEVLVVSADPGGRVMLERTTVGH